MQWRRRHINSKISLPPDQTDIDAWDSFYDTINFDHESNISLIGCGIDGEMIDRFTRFSHKNNPLPMVFSPGEINHIRTLTDQRRGFCASFCCKEAFLKAFGYPFNFTQCELFYKPNKTLQRPILSLRDDRSQVINDCTVRFMCPQPGEMVAIVHLYGRR